MKTLFDPRLYQFDTPQPSYWEATAGDLELHCKPLVGAHNCDVAIIGGGYTGLSAGVHPDAMADSAPSAPLSGNATDVGR